MKAEPAANQRPRRTSAPPWARPGRLRLHLPVAQAGNKHRGGRAAEGGEEGAGGGAGGREERRARGGGISRLSASQFPLLVLLSIWTVLRRAGE